MRLSSISLLAGVTSVLAQTLNINNWCGDDVSVYLSNGGSCDFGPAGICSSLPGGDPYLIPSHALLTLGLIANGQGTSVKMFRGADRSKILQLEYNLAWNGFWYDFSNLDGKGPNLVGTPFENDNVKVSPSGNGAGVGQCQDIRCKAGTVCWEAYQCPTCAIPLVCPVDTGALWLDLCEPQDQFLARREVKFIA